MCLWRAARCWKDLREEQARAQQGFIDAFKQASPDFQDRHGYPSGKYRAELLKLASKYVGHHFKCVSLTLELPFKDNANMPDETLGWNGARSAPAGRGLPAGHPCDAGVGTLKADEPAQAGSCVS